MRQYDLEMHKNRAAGLRFLTGYRPDPLQKLTAIPGALSYIYRSERKVMGRQHG